jgi:hypothetical protein
MTIWDASGTQVANYSSTNFLQPGQQTTASWSHRLSRAGEYWVQFGVWKATPYVIGNLMDKKPSPAQRLIIAK